MKFQSEGLMSGCFEQMVLDVFIFFLCRVQLFGFYIFSGDFKKMADTTVEICHCISFKFNDQKSVTTPENLVVKDSVHAKKSKRNK